MAEDPVLSQQEIDALLRAASGEGEDQDEVAAAQRPAPEEIVIPDAQPPAELRPEELPAGLGLLLGVRVRCTVELGRARIALGDLIGFGRSSLIVLDGRVDAPVVLKLNGVPFARGAVVESNGRYSVQISEMLSQRQAAG